MIQNSYDNDVNMIICNQKTSSVCPYGKIFTEKLIFQSKLKCRYSSFYD
jgi:hypothetical protein